NGSLHSAWRYARLGAPLIDGSGRLLMLLYNNVAGLRQFRGAPSRAVADRHHSNARIKNASAATAEDLNIEIADFLPQGIAINPEQIRRADLVTAGSGQSHREERMLDLAQDTVVEAGGRQGVAETREVRGQVAFHRGRKPLLCRRLLGAGKHG